MDDVDIGALRRRYKLTQARVAERAGMQQPVVSAVETGARTSVEARARVLAAVRALARPRDGLTPEVRTAIARTFARYGATDVRVVGSVAKGSDRAGSDVDFLVRLPERFSGFALMDLIDDLERILGVSVDVISDYDEAGPSVRAMARSAKALEVV